MTWVNKINQVIPKQPRSGSKQINWSTDQLPNVNWNNFNPAATNYDIKIKDSLLNKNKFEEYWKQKKIENFYERDVDNDGLTDLTAVDKDGFVRGFNNKVTYPKSESLLPYKQNYYKQSKEQRENNPFKIYLERQNNVNGYKSLDKYKSSRNSSIWKQIYNWFLSENRTNGYKLSQVEAYSKQVAKLIPYVFFNKSVDESDIKVIIKEPEFKQMVKDEIYKKSIGFFLPTNLELGYNLATLKDDYRTAKEFDKFRCKATTAKRLVNDINLRNQATKLRKQAQDNRKDTGFNEAFIEFMRQYYQAHQNQPIVQVNVNEENSETEEEDFAMDEEQRSG